jgi:hypothetical protein
VFVDGTFTMSGGEISGNSTPVGGGGVRVHRGTFTMSGGEISDNSSTYGSGGVEVYNGTFTMNAGEISSNTGGGVYVYGTFTMDGGEISGNISSSNIGAGVYVYNGTFTMSGGARVSGDNPICLSSYYSLITIGGDFTGLSGPVATIDLYGGIMSEWLGKAVLKLDTGYFGDLSSLRSHFTLGNLVNSVATPLTDYMIDTDGKLTTAP